MVRYEEDASDPTAVWRIATAANHKADRVQQQKGDFQKVMTELHESMDRWEALLQRLVNSQAQTLDQTVGRGVSHLQPSEKSRSVEDLCQINLNSTQGIQLMSTTEGNFKFPTTYPSVVVTGWGEDPLPHPPLACPSLNPSHGPELASQCPQYPRKLPEMVHSDDLENPEVYGIDPYTHNWPKEIMPAVFDWSIDDKHAFIEENKQVRYFTGSGNTPMVYFLKQVIEEIQKSAKESGDRRIAKMCLGMLKAMRSHHEYNYVAYKKGIGVVGNKKGGFDVDDRWLWSTGLLWTIPPWPDLSLCEADWMPINIEKGVAAMCLMMAAMFGGTVGQEVVQACSGKFHPVYQFFYFDSVESLPIEPLEFGDLKPKNTRYTAQISVFGSKLRKKLEQVKIFMVGSGTLGCEVLKNLALMGISYSPDGKLTVTDDDVIEQSNLSHQFLVHDWNSGQPKSTVDATIVMAINPKNYVEAQMLPKSHYCYFIGLTLEYCKFSSLDADEITKESRRRLSNSFGKIRYCLNEDGLMEASDATYQQSDLNGLCLFAEISALHMKFCEEVLHLIDKRLQQEIIAKVIERTIKKMGHLSYYIVSFLTGGSSSVDVLEVVGQNYSEFVLNITSKKLKPGFPSEKSSQGVISGTNNSDSQKCNSEQIHSANGVVFQDINSTDEHIGDCKVESSAFPLSTEDTISETRYPADNWNSCQFVLSNGSPVHNNQSVPQSGLSYGDNDLSYIDWPGIDNFEEVDTLFRCDSTYGQQQLENTDELSWIPSSLDAIYSPDVALQPGFESSYSDYGIMDVLSAFNCTHDKSLPTAAVYDKLYKVATSLKVHILDPNYVPGQNKDLNMASVQHTVIWMGRKQKYVEEVPCGNTVDMVGSDQFITKNTTLTNEKEIGACQMRAMKLSVSFVVHVAVQYKVASNLPKLIESLKCLVKSDPMVLCSLEESGEHICDGFGELNRETCLEDLLKTLQGKMRISLKGNLQHEYAGRNGVYLEGAGIAAILNYMPRENKLSSFSCIAFGPAACMTWELAEFGKDFVMTIVSRNNLGPTFGKISADSLRTEVMASSWAPDIREQIQQTRILGFVNRSVSFIRSYVSFVYNPRSKVVDVDMLLSRTPKAEAKLSVDERAEVKKQSALPCWSFVAANRQTIESVVITTLEDKLVVKGGEMSESGLCVCERWGETLSEGNVSSELSGFNGRPGCLHTLRRSIKGPDWFQPC